MPNRERGQAVLLVVIVMAVVVTVVLSVVARSVVDVRTSSKEEESLRAFSAAEAGVERLLVGTATTLSENLNNSSFSATVTNFSLGTLFFNHPKELLSGDSSGIWLVSHDVNGDLSCSGGLPCFSGDEMKICWGRSGNSQVPALAIALYYDLNGDGNFNDLRIRPYPVDPDATRRASNRFNATDPGSCTIDGITYPYQKTINLSSIGIPIGANGRTLPNGLQIIKVVSLYNTSETNPFGIDVTLSDGGVLPSQGRKIESIGQSGESQRKVEVFSLYSDWPSFFDWSIFTKGAFIKS